MSAPVSPVGHGASPAGPEPAPRPPAGGRLGRYARSFTGFERDAQIFLLTTLVAGAATSLYWIDFNLYLQSLGVSRPTIGLIAAAASIAGVVVAFPASGLSDRIGRRWVMAIGLGLVLVAFVGFLSWTSLAALAAFAACYGAGSQATQIVASPFLTEHSRRDHRNELFAVQFAISNLTNVGAAVLGGVVAAPLAVALGLGGTGPGPYRILLGLMAALTLAALATVFLISDDRPRPRIANLPAARSGRPGRFGITIVDRGRFVRLLLPGFLTSLGAGQIIPFLNVFIEGKFHLDIASLNAVFAVTSLGTTVAVLLQPALARRLGKVGSVVLVQAVSIPFFVVLGFSPLLWSVVLAMAVRNSLMNAGNPIFNAFAMESLGTTERATYSAAANLLWSLGWSVGEPFYSLAQASFGFEVGYAIDFFVVIVLYTVATYQLWDWFGKSERVLRTADVPSQTT